MAKRNCPACGASLDNNVSSSGYCLFCGHDLALTAPPPGWKVGKIDLRSVARRQRYLLWIILGSIVVQFSSMFASAQASIPWVGLVFLLLMLLLSGCGVFCIVRLLVALGVHVVWVVLAAILMLAPCINLLLLLHVNGLATAALQRTGLKVGFMGVRDDTVVRHLSGNLCKSCGYLLIGIASERCPECGEPMAVSQRSNEAP